MPETSYILTSLTLTGFRLHSNVVQYYMDCLGMVWHPMAPGSLYMNPFAPWIGSRDLGTR